MAEPRRSLRCLRWLRCDLDRCPAPARRRWLTDVAGAVGTVDAVEFFYARPAAVRADLALRNLMIGELETVAGLLRTEVSTRGPLELATGIHSRWQQVRAELNAAGWPLSADGVLLSVGPMLLPGWADLLRTVAPLSTDPQALSKLPAQLTDDPATQVAVLVAMLIVYAGLIESLARLTNTPATVVFARISGS